MVGVTLAAPLSHIAPDLIKPFNALLYSAQGVFTAQDPEPPTLPDHVDPCPGTWDAAQPAPPPASPTDPGADAQWVAVRAAWKAPAVVVDDGSGGGKVVSQQAVVQDVVDVMMWSMGWGSENALDNQVVMADKPSDEPLVWRNFEDMYLAAPMLSVKG
jgi:hypothetical protein